MRSAKPFLAAFAESIDCRPLGVVREELFTQLDTKTAAAELDHSMEVTTLRHYDKRTHIAPDLWVVLDLLVDQPDSDSPEPNVTGK